MRYGRNQVSQEKSDLPFRFDLDALVIACMAGCDDRCHAGNEFRIAMQELPLIDVIDRRKIVRAVAGSRPFIGAGSILKFTPLNGVTSLGKDRPDTSHPLESLYFPRHGRNADAC